MNISSVTSASKMQELMALLASSSSGTMSGSDSLISSLLGSHSDSLSISDAGQRLSKAQGSNPFQTDFDNLGQLISSGDLASAKKAYAAMQERMKAHESESQSGGDRGGFESDFEALGTALDSGDASTALAAWNTLQSKFEAFSETESSSASDATGTASSTVKAADLQALLVSMYSQQASWWTSSTNSAG